MTDRDRRDAALDMLYEAYQSGGLPDRHRCRPTRTAADRFRSLGAREPMAEEIGLALGPGSGA